MGDLFRKQQVKNFKKGRDLALEELAKPRLIERPDVVHRIFTIEPLDGANCNIGELLLALTENADGPIFAVRGYEKVGVIGGEGATILRQVMTTGNQPYVAQIRITNVSDLSGCADSELLAGS